jgi:hypothetical protein
MNQATETERRPRAGTYRTLDEQSGMLSPAQERFERARRTGGRWASCFPR